MNSEQQYIHYLAHMLDEAMGDKSPSSKSGAFAVAALKAKLLKDDEYYTSYEDAKALLEPFSKNFHGKKILMNCDDPMKSKVFKYMYDNFDAFGLKELKSIGYGCSEMLVVKPGDVWDSYSVANNGDFRVGESLQALKECDVVVSNPPFSRSSSSDLYSLGLDFFRLPIENGKDVIGINDIRNTTSGVLHDYILAGRLKAYRCPYKKFIRPKDAKTDNNLILTIVLSTFKNVDGLATGLKLDTKLLFYAANEIGLKYVDLPEYPLSKMKSYNDRRVDVRILNIDGYSNNSTLMPIPPKPTIHEVPSILRCLIAIPYFLILNYNWERYFNMVDFRKILTTVEVPNTNERRSINNSYCVFEYRGNRN